jgi:hypothetical protein
VGGRFWAGLGARGGGALLGVWVCGAGAGGAPPLSEDSDVDVLVLVDDDSWDGKTPVFDALRAAARELDLEDLAWYFSVHVQTPEWLHGRRAIESFFIAEVDRDKIVVAGTG